MIFYKEANFKETPIGKIPKTWQVVSIGDVCQQRNEIVQPSINNKEPFVGLEHIASGETRLQKFAQSADVRSAKFRFYAGDILYGKLRPYLDKAVIAIFNGICSTDLLVLTPKENVVKEFLIYVLHSNDFIKYAIATTTGTNHPRTSWSAISKFKFGLPEYLEQQKIADILLTVDEAIQKTNEIIAKTERLKKGLMQELLTKGVGHKEFKDTEIGRIPEEWEVVRLENVVEIWDKYRVPVKEQDRKPGPFPYCGANGIIDYIAGYTHDGEFVLLAEDGGFFGPFENSAYIMRGKFWANNHVHILKAIEGILINEFLMYCLNFMDLTPFLTGSTRPKLTQENTRKIPLPLPPIQEQQRIAEILTTIDRKLEIERNEKAKLERIKQGLMDLLLTGKIRVKVNQIVP